MPKKVENLREPGQRALPDPEITPTITVPQAARLLGVSRAAAYTAIQRGEVPALRIGHRLVVPTADLRRLLGHHDPLR
jgi:excisionase family DNA binding protein